MDFYMLYGYCTACVGQPPLRKDAAYNGGRTTSADFTAILSVLNFLFTKKRFNHALF
jgi:hypothetical protein